jgi:hypothetical protein
MKTQQLIAFLAAVVITLVLTFLMDRLLVPEQVGAVLRPPHLVAHEDAAAGHVGVA